jgi:hypothetical protein
LAGGGVGAQESLERRLLETLLSVGHLEDTGGGLGVRRIFRRGASEGGVRIVVRR